MNTNTNGIKSLFLTLFLSFYFLVSLNGFASWHERGYTTIEQYGSFTDFFHSECDLDVDVHCDNTNQNNKDGYRQDLSASDAYLANCEKDLALEVGIGYVIGSGRVSACRSAQSKSAAIAVANAAYNNGDYKKAFDVFRSLAGSRQPFRIVSQSDVVWGGNSNFEPFYDAAQGNAIAQQRLGQMYDEGKGVPQDYNEAVYWYSRSYKHGYVTAEEYNRILSKGRVKGFTPDNY